MTTTPTKSGLKILEEWNKINLGQETKNACALLKNHYKEYNYPIKVFFYNYLLIIFIKYIYKWLME